MSADALLRVRGYEAADKIIGQMVSEARERCPQRPQNRMSAAFRSGYFEGLLAAQCQLALGEFPNQPENKKCIEENLLK